MKTLDKEIELLRQRAQAALVNAPDVGSRVPEDMADAMRLVEELRVYQTELEIQNQDLKAAQLQTEVAMRKYKRLFENLPLEGMILDDQGFIVEANAVARSRFSLRQQTALQRRSVYQIFSMDSRAALHAALTSKGELAHASQCQLAAGTASQTSEVDAHIIVLDPESFVNEERLMVLVDRTSERKLAEFNRDFEAFLDQTTDFVYFKNRESRFRFCSQTLARICGQADWRDMIGKHDRDVFLPDMAQIYEDEERPIFLQGQPLLNKVNPYLDANGKPGFVQTNKWPLFDGAGAVSGIFGISRDVTESRHAQARMQLSANVFTHAREGILITDENNLIVEVNDAFTRITGYSRDEVIGQSPRMFRSGRQDAQFYAGMWDSINTLGHWEGEVWNRRKDGAVYAEMLSISAVSDDEGLLQHYVALFTDISQQKQHERELEHIAHYDVLTGLPNRVLLSDRLQQEMAHCMRLRKQLAVVFIDLDGFKLVNDQHGHNMGDELLIALSLRMKGALRDGDTLSRIGGDEFVAVLTGLDLPKDCEIVLARLLDAAAQPVVANGIALQVSASIGVTLFPQDTADADQLLRHADHAMYQAKQSGKSRYHYFDVKHDTDVKTRSESLEEISLGLDRGEFVLHYQPKVNMKTGAVLGLEALIRWQHPVRGLVAPDDFLPVIQGHPLCIKLGDWVVQTAVTQLVQWNATDLQTTVSVNIDAMHLQNIGFVEGLQRVLAQHPDVQPKQLALEILETSALGDMDRVIVTMHACCAMGVGFALDDFGTGYSSLTYLKRLPAELIKIDQSFVTGMIDDSDDFVIVEGVVGLAKAFGRNVMAEGVETVAHGKLLLALGCEMGQGYGIAHAMPADTVAGWLKDWRPDPSWLL
jgi:diguanylate cyclase (GGDEF)-like protein/PAS domain S-box-containing protein